MALENEPEMAINVKSSRASTFSALSYMMAKPPVARRSPTVRTPPSYLTAMTVVPWMSDAMPSEGRGALCAAGDGAAAGFHPTSDAKSVGRAGASMAYWPLRWR